MRALVLDAADVRAGNATLTFSLVGDVFSTALLAEDAPGLAALALEMGREFASARAYHEPGWSRGWSTVVQHALSTHHVTVLSPAALRIALPAADHYGSRGPELIRMALPDALYACGLAAPQQPPTVLFVHEPRLSITSITPAAGPIGGGTVVHIGTRGVASRLRLTCLFGSAAAVTAIPDAVSPGGYLCVTPARNDAASSSSGGGGHGGASGIWAVPVRLLQPGRMEGLVFDVDEMATTLPLSRLADMLLAVRVHSI